MDSKLWIQLVKPIKFLPDNLQEELGHWPAKLLRDACILFGIPLAKPEKKKTKAELARLLVSYPINSLAQETATDQCWQVLNALFQKSNQFSATLDGLLVSNPSMGSKTTIAQA